MGLIFWLVMAIIGTLFIYAVGAMVFMVASARKLFTFLTREATELPADYHTMRKAVKNENSPSAAIEIFVKRVFVRWYKRK